MNVSIQNCPVPPDQQPLNEYQSLKNSWFFKWSTASNPSYVRTLAIIWLGGWVLSFPFAIEALVGLDFSVKHCLAAHLGSSAFLLLVLLRLYLGWRYVRYRLEREVVEYEETGWYDGQIWKKEQPQRDRELLISTYEVRPWMNRLMITLAIVVALGVVGIGAWPLF